MPEGPLAVLPAGVLSVPELACCRTSLTNWVSAASYVAVRLVLPDDLGRDRRGVVAEQHPLAVGAKVPEPAVQETPP